MSPQSPSRPHVGPPPESGRWPRRVLASLVGAATLLTGGLLAVEAPADVTEARTQDAGQDGADPTRQSVPVRAAAAGPVVAAQDASVSPSPSTSSSPAVPDAPLRDPYRPQQWHLDRIGLTADRRVPDGAGQVIAILDSGVDLAHPDLSDVLLRTPDGDVVGRDLVDDDDDPQDRFGHGTMVAGIAAARSGNGLGVAGTVSGRVELLPVRVLDDQGRGSSQTVAAGIDWAIDRGATVVNLSLESAGVRQIQADERLRQAVDDALAAGAVVVVAAGNSDAEGPEVTDRRGTVVVGGTDREDQRAGFSDRGRLDLVMAPGVEIVSTWCRSPDGASCDGETHTYGIADGTSFAAPQVSGLVAMLASTGLTPHEALDRLAATTIDLGEPGPDAHTGRGLVSAETSLGAWPDVAVPASIPAPLVATGDASAGAGAASPQAVAPAEPPPASGLPTRILVVAAILAAVGLLVHGLAGAPRHRDGGRGRERDPERDRPDAGG